MASPKLRLVAQPDTSRMKRVQQLQDQARAIAMAEVAEFESGLGASWRDTAVVVATEFGRTARINGTEGTDHGTGTIALLAGGAIKGGRVITDWPSLKPASLYQQRDLMPTTDLRAVIKGVLADHLGIGDNALANTIFPDSGAVRPMRGLIA